MEYLEMASHFSTYTRAAFSPAHKPKNPLLLVVELPWESKALTKSQASRAKRCLEARVSNGGDSYLDMWKKAVDRERKAIEFQKIAESMAGIEEEEEERERPEVVERKSSEFQKIVEVSTEERDRIQRMQVIDRAAAAIAAARALLKENSMPVGEDDSNDLGSLEIDKLETDNGGDIDFGAQQGGDIFFSQSDAAGIVTPGPNFWSWTPGSDKTTDDINELKPAGKTFSSPIQANPLIDLDRYVDYLSLPLESKMGSNHNPPLPPLQSLMEVKLLDGSISATPQLAEKHEVTDIFSTHAAQAAHALGEVDPVGTIAN